MESPALQRLRIGGIVRSAVPVRRVRGAPTDQCDSHKQSPTRQTEACNRHLSDVDYVASSSFFVYQEASEPDWIEVMFDRS